MDTSIRPELPGDRAAIHEVNRLAFGQDEEANLVDALRDGGFARLSLVAEVDGQIVGHILFSEMAIITPSGSISALSLAPMAVRPQWQRRGIGSQLVHRGLEECREAGHRIAIVLGHPAFYPRFGFRPELAAVLESPFPRDAFMAIELTPGALTGVRGRVAYPPPFGI